MGKDTRNLGGGSGVGTPLHSRETLFTTGNLAINLAEVQLPADGCGTVFIDVRGTFVGTVSVQGSMDGVNWNLIPIKPVVGPKLQISTTAVGSFSGDCSQYLRVRAIMTPFTSGSATVVLAADNSVFTYGQITTDLGTVTAAAGVAATLTLAAPGVGLRHYLTYIRIVKICSVAIAAGGAAPILVTTTNIPGTMQFSIANNAMAVGDVLPYQEDFAFPIASSAQNTATTIVAPLTASVIWRITAGFFVAP